MFAPAPPTPQKNKCTSANHDYLNMFCSNDHARLVGLQKHIVMCACAFFFFSLLFHHI